MNAGLRLAFQLHVCHGMHVADRRRAVSTLFLRLVERFQVPARTTKMLMMLGKCWKWITTGKSPSALAFWQLQSSAVPEIHQGRRSLQALVRLRHGTCGRLWGWPGVSAGDPVPESGGAPLAAACSDNVN
jgi:hypothetical protein